jgi:hypothetical protein
LDQVKARIIDKHEAIVNTNIDDFEMSYEESVSYFKRSENLEKIRRTIGLDKQPSSNSRRILAFKTKLDSEISLWISFSKK